MANFKTAYDFTAGVEKGYTVDNGGKTYAGISWKGWGNDPLVKQIFAIVDAAKPKRGDIINNPQLTAMILAFYKKNYWDVIKGDSITTQGLANLIYDFFVNSNSAIVIINRVCGGREVGYMNETTLKNLNDRPGFCYNAIRTARKNLYDKLAKSHPVFYKNNTYDGWIARLNKFPKNLTA